MFCWLKVCVVAVVCRRSTEALFLRVMFDDSSFDFVFGLIANLMGFAKASPPLRYLDSFCLMLFANVIVGSWYVKYIRLGSAHIVFAHGSARLGSYNFSSFTPSLPPSIPSPPPPRPCPARQIMANPWRNACFVARHTHVQYVEPPSHPIYICICRSICICRC